MSGHATIEYLVKCSFSYYCQDSVGVVAPNLKLGKNGCITYDIILKNVSSFAQNVLINASVVENGTGIRGKALSKIEIRNFKKRYLPEFSVETRKKKFKPGLPFKGQVLSNFITSNFKFFIFNFGQIKHLYFKCFR